LGGPESSVRNQAAPLITLITLDATQIVICPSGSLVRDGTSSFAEMAAAINDPAQSNAEEMSFAE
jgi:hypothetical protein